ncbi:54S ribosomal protein L33, mitochondrial, partial [Pseudozyma hubeiensis]
RLANVYSLLSIPPDTPLPLFPTFPPFHHRPLVQRSAYECVDHSAEQPAPPTHYRITLRRSGIGMPEKINRTLQGLGLKKRLQSVYRPIGADMAGAILAVKELVHVENVRRLQQADQMLLSDQEAVWVNEVGEIVDPGKAAKKAPRGYKVVGNVVSEVRDQQIKGASS